MKKTLLFITLLFTTIIYTQTLPIDFETATTWADFDGGVMTTETNPFNNSDNSSANVGKMVKNAGQPWGGSSLVLGSAMDFANNNTFTMKVYSPRANAKVLLKVENSGDSAINFEKEVLTTVANGWETLTFDYSAINSGNSYDKLVIIFDNGTMGDGTANFTFYVDDIALSNITSNLTQMDLPVTFEDATVDYGVIGFGDTISTIEANHDATGANNSSTVVKVIKQASSPTWAGTTITANAELGFVTNIPLTISNAKMYVAVWSPDAGIQVRLKAEDHADNTHTVETEATTTVANAWEVLEFDMANEAPGTAALQTGIDNGWVYNKVSIFFNFGVDGATAGEKTYYFDNASFSQPILGVEKNEFSNNLILYPNPVEDILNINTTSKITNIKIYNILGKKVKEIKKLENSFLNISDLNGGIYLLKIESETGLVTKKIVKK